MSGAESYSTFLLYSPEKYGYQCAERSALAFAGSSQSLNGSLGGGVAKKLFFRQVLNIERCSV